MNMRINETARLYELPPYTAAPAKADAAEKTKNIERDSYIPSWEEAESVCSTGNYDSTGEMDDDFSLDLEPGSEDLMQTAQYNMDYARQLLKTVAAAEASDGRTPR